MAMSYRKIAERAGISHGAVGYLLTRPMSAAAAMDISRRNSLDRGAIRERQQEIVVTRLAETVHGALDLVEAAIRAGNAKDFAQAMKGIELPQKVLDRAAGRARVAPAAAPIDFDVLLHQILDRSSASLPKVS
jgi:hypothetical protein